MPVSKTEMSLLTTAIKETLATNFDTTQQKIFSAADLWNIQRNKRRNLGRRFIA
jgi:hypothetical protein